MESQPRLLLEAEHVLPCGYAPRTLLQSIHGRDRERVFVGCKDGSLAVIERSGEGFRLNPLVDSPQQGSRPRAVRALRELDDSHLLVGRSHGAVEVVDWREAITRNKDAYQRLRGPKKDPEEAVRYIQKRDDLWLVSWRRETRLYTWDAQERQLRFVQKLLAQRPDVPRPAPLRGVRVCVPYTEPSRHWLIATSRGELWNWERVAGGMSEVAVLVGDLWLPGQAPGFVDDFAVLRQPPRDPQDPPTLVKTLFLATDLGVYAIDLGLNKPKSPVRLSLPGLDAVCMALSAVPLEREPYDFLWAADAQGDSHLFWRASAFKAPPFLPSGIVHVGSQVMLAISWQRPPDGSLVFAQARRNDSVALSEYTVILPDGKRVGGSGSGDVLQEKLRHDRDLLLDGKLENIRKVVGGSPAWPPYAVLADLFELLAARDDSLRALREFLSNPSGAVACKALEGLTEGEVGAAVRLWVLTLLGIVNRMKDPGETPYLGIVRWLRDLELLTRDDESLRLALARGVRKGIRFARKWGLFGKANAQRRHLVKPLEILRTQLSAEPHRRRWKPGIGGQSEAIDLLTYESLLFHRSFDVLHEDSRGRMKGRSAWDLATLEEESRQIVAVSWMWGGVELYELRRGPGGAVQLDMSWALHPNQGSPEKVPPESRVPSAEWQEKYGYSRAVLLGKVEGQRFLLTAPTRDRSSQERIHLWKIEDQPGLEVEECAGSDCALLEGGESVYCFLELEPGRILAGLRGTRGKPRLALIEVGADPSGPLTLRMKSFDLLSTGAGSETTLQNRVWSLARAIPRSLQGEEAQWHRVAVGCESGDILTFTLPRRPDPDDLPDEKVVERVAQLSSQVVSLAYLSEYQTRSKGPAERIFAGGEDGTVMAWQKGDGDPTGFVSLWATVERGAVAAIHVLPYGPPGPEQEPLILAVTRAGRCTVLDDRSDLSAPAGDRAPWQPQRPRFPGKRLRRSALGGTAFASGLLCRLPSLEGEGEPVWNGETGRYAVLLLASEQGKIRLASLHYPQSPQRRRQYDRTVGLWWQIAYQEGQHDRLRLVDAAYQAAPLLPLILVRWVLAPEAKRRSVRLPPVPEHEEEWRMPRYLRPLLRLRQAWDRGDYGRAAEALNELLLHAWRLDDLALFQQVCAVTLQRANFAICEAARRSGGDEANDRLCDLYLAVFDVIERSLQRWLGSPEKEIRARIIVAKNLVDGDTFLRVLRRAELELKRNPREKGPFRKILDKRIEGVRQLVFKQDPLLSLETFRALNLSLMRLCRRLVDRPGKDGRREEVSWTVFASYFEALTYAAARTFHSRLDLNDSLAHEYCRTFALAVCACPSAAIRIANRMTETQLISDPESDQDLSRRVIRQFDVLEQIGIPVPSEAAQLFQMASCPPKGELNPVGAAMKDLGFGKKLKRLERLDDPDVIKEFGTENAEDLYCLFRLYEVVDWFTELGKRLSTDAKELDLTAGRLVWLKKRLHDSQEGSLKRLFSHSVDFWSQAIDPLNTLVLEEPSKDTIRPEMILLSRKLERWAGEQIERLHGCYRDLQIFQPEYPIYHEVLARLERAARDFPLSAAVQKNLVVSVFGHHLLEDLDEHVFELEELAQNLDPLLVWKFRDAHRAPRSLDGGRRAAAQKDVPVAQKFAEYLLRRANYAESLPKNLRALYGILESPPRGKDEYPFQQLFEPLGWDSEGSLPGVQIQAQDFQFLSLTLAELESNHQKHSGLTPRERRKHKPRYACLAPKPVFFSVRFWFRWDDENARRLEELRLKGLQEPLPPRGDRAVASTGAGLYLANLAASVVNWQLRLSREKILREGRMGVCKFELLQTSEREVPRP